MIERIILMGEALQSHTSTIRAGMPSTTNDPAIFDGKSGYWVQGDCVFISASSPQEAIDSYRKRMTKAMIGISHNLHCDGIRNIQLRSDREDAQHDG